MKVKNSATITHFLILQNNDKENIINIHPP